MYVFMIGIIVVTCWCDAVKVVVIDGNGVVLFSVIPLFMYTAEMRCLSTSLIHSREHWLV